MLRKNAPSSFSVVKQNSFAHDSLNKFASPRIRLDGVRRTQRNHGEETSVHVLITANPGYGHLAPLIPFAMAIRDAGHDVAIATSEQCRAGLSEYGVELEPCGPSWLESDYGRSDTPSLPTADLGAMYTSQHVPRMFADVDKAVARRRPDVIVSNDFEPTGRVAAERAGIPFVLASSGPRMARPVRQIWHAALLRDARRLGGLAEDGTLDYTLRWLHLCFAPADWVFRGWATEVHGTHVEAANEVGIRPRLADLGAAGSAGPAVAPGPSHPVVLCTFGTLFNKRPALVRAVIAGLVERVARLMVVLGPGVDPRDFAVSAPHVELRARASIPQLLQEVDYVVTHGGASTLTALQLAGKPSLLLPQGADQPVNALACLHRGLSVVRFHTPGGLRVGALPDGPMTPEAVGSAFDALTADAGYVQRAQEFAAVFAALPPLERAVELLERLASTREPVLACANA